MGREFATRLTPSPGAGLVAKGWRGEWAVSSAALGLMPAPGLKIPFNMGASYGGFGKWHCWEGALAENRCFDPPAALQLK